MRGRQLVVYFTTEYTQQTHTISIVDMQVADPLPWLEEITPYDKAHLATYLRLLDADTSGVPEETICSQILQLDGDPDRSWRILADHLKRAKWMTTDGYKLLLQLHT